MAERIADDLDIGGAPVGQAAVAVTDPGIFDQVDAVTCDVELKTLEVAIDAFTAMEGRPPVDETELVGTYIREASIGFDISPEGMPVPAPGSPCV